MVAVVPEMHGALLNKEDRAQVNHTPISPNPIVQRHGPSRLLELRARFCDKKSARKRTQKPAQTPSENRA